MAVNQEDLDVGRRKAIQAFQFLEALNQLRNPVTRMVEDQPWHLWLRDLPDHPSIERGRRQDAPPAEAALDTEGEEPPPDPVAPKWANSVRQRYEGHGSGKPPGDVRDAWLWRQLQLELDDRASVSMDRLQGEIEQLNKQLEQTTGDLVDSLAWAAQIRRTHITQRQALVGWLKLQKKIGKGTGKRAPRLKAAARATMADCRSAIPVWVMPISRVVDSFDFRETKFDVVIIDEASQSDVMALVAFFLGRQVLVVGDDQQVTPDAVGQDVSQVQKLIDAHLVGIPNAELYDGQTSVYDLAGAGSTVCLREHFRCVPDIIGFSNRLSYDGALKPLRDPSLAKLKPHVVPYHVNGMANAQGYNEVEAHAVASLIMAALEQPEYAQNTKARSLHSELFPWLASAKPWKSSEFSGGTWTRSIFEKRRIVCGNSAQFQGDERDVMFLTMVDSPEGRLLPIRTQPLFKKRYNVAASRARDQMWVVYSLDPQVDLKAGDLRLELIQYAMDPAAALRAFEQAEGRTESEFERRVLHQLLAAGYRVRPQWRVGYYRIDLVVEGGRPATGSRV